MQHRDHAGLAADMIDGIEAQPVEAILGQPIQRVLDREGAHLRHAIVDRAAPRRMGIGEKVRRVAAEIIPLRAEVIVDHVEEHHQPAQMRFVDQRLQIFGPAIGAVGRVPQHAVIAPAAAAGEIRQRHQLQRGDAGFDEMVELLDHLAIRPALREGAGVGLDQHGLFPGPSAPIPRTPFVSAVIDHLARTEHILGLEARGGIGHVDLAVDAELVARAGFGGCNIQGEPAIVAAHHRPQAVEQEIDALGRWRP